MCVEKKKQTKKTWHVTGKKTHGTKDKDIIQFKLPQNMNYTYVAMLAS